MACPDCNVSISRKNSFALKIQKNKKQENSPGVLSASSRHPFKRPTGVSVLQVLEAVGKYHDTCSFGFSWVVVLSSRCSHLWPNRSGVWKRTFYANRGNLRGRELSCSGKWGRQNEAEGKEQENML